MGNFPSQQNTPLDPRMGDTPLNNNSQQTPLNPGAGQEPVSTPIPQQPLESQGIPGGQVPGDPSQELATPAQRQELLDMLAATEEKMRELQTGKFRSSNELEVARIETLKQIFIMMQESGVDLNDPASVASFLDRLRSANPEMAQTFEATLEDLLGDNEPAETQMGMSEPPSMEANEAIPENVRGPVQGQAGNPIG